MSDFEEFNGLENRAGALNQTLATTNVMVSGFDSELRRMRSSLSATGRDVKNLETGLSKGLRKAFDGLVFDGMKLSDALKTVAETLSRSVYNAAIRPVTNHFGGLVSAGLGSLAQSAVPASGQAAAPAGLSGVVQAVAGLLPFEKGASFSQGRVQPFAEGAAFAGGRAVAFAQGGVMGQGRVVPFAMGGVVSGPTAFPMRGGMGLMGEAGPEAIMPLARGSDGKLGVKAAGRGGDVSIVMNIATPDVAGFQRSHSQIAAQMRRALSAADRNR